MPAWGVSEPYVNLWLHDEPLGYQPAVGPRISFQLDFKQRETSTGFATNVFSAGKKWNFSWLSCVTTNASGPNVVLFPGGKEVSFVAGQDLLTDTRLSGNTNAGFSVSYPDGSQDIYGFIVTNSAGVFLGAYLTQRLNPQSQGITLQYAAYTNASPVVRLTQVVDGDGRTNFIYYSSTNVYSTNLISKVVDAFGRTNSLFYDTNGHLSSLTDVQGLSSSFTYDTNDCVNNLTTPYGSTGFGVTDIFGPNSSPAFRSVLVTQPDGGNQLYYYQDSALGVPASYGAAQVPNIPFPNTLDTNGLNFHNTYYWGPRQCSALSTNNTFLLTSNDFAKGRLKHWLLANDSTVSEVLSMRRDPSPDSAGLIQGQTTWYDYAGKTNDAYIGTQVQPLLVARVLPDGTTWFTRSDRNPLGAVTNQVSTYTSGGSVLTRTNTFVFATNGLDLLAATNAIGVQTSSNVYNSAHQVLTNYDAIGQMTVYTYNANQQVSSITRPSGLVTTNLYGSDNSLLSNIDIQIGRTNSYTYVNDLVYTHTDERGMTTTYLYDSLQRVTNASDSRGAITYTYSNLDLIQVVDRMGFTNSYAYDSLRRRIAETNALGAPTVYNYCLCGSLNWIQDAAGNYTHFFYDNLGRTINVVYPDLYSVTNNYNLLGQFTNITDSAGSSTTNWFNNQGLQIAVSNAFGLVTSTIYDALDRPTNTTDADGVTVSTTCDNLNRQLSRAYPDNGLETFGYALNVSAMTSYTNQIGNVVLYAYDPAGRKTNEAYPGVTTNGLTYTPASDLLTLTDGKNQTTTWRYDQFGRVTNKLDNLGTNLFFYCYDAETRLTSRTSAAKGTTTYHYDAVGNLTNIVYPINTPITMAYDVLNRRTIIVDGVGTTRYSYNAASQLLSEGGLWQDDTVSYTYLNRLRIGLSLAQPAADAWAQSYGYDPAKRLTSLTSPAGGFSYAYDPARHLQVGTLTLPNGAYITNSYDSVARWLSTALESANASVINSHAYSYNAASQRAQQVFTASNYVNYTYDNIGQLKLALGQERGGVTNRLQEQLGYAYDPAGNLNWRTNNALIERFNVNSLNELTTETNSGTLTVAGTTTSHATNVTVNGVTAANYSDNTFAKDGFTATNGNNSFTAIAQDSYGAKTPTSPSATCRLPIPFPMTSTGTF